MGPVASFAAAANGPVYPGCFGLVARRATRRRKPGVRLVTLGALLMPDRRTLELGLMATPAGGCSRWRMRNSAPVAGDAVAVAFVFGHEREFSRVTAGAEIARSAQNKPVRLVASFAREACSMRGRLDDSHVGVAAAASRGDEGGVLRVWRVTSYARALPAVLDMHICMTRRAGSSGAGRVMG